MLQQFRASPRMQDMDFPAEFMLPLMEEAYDVGQQEEQVQIVPWGKNDNKKIFLG